MITKTELIEILKSTGAPVNENIASQSNTNKFPRIVFWEFVWEEIDASDSSYDSKVSYQVSVHYKRPRDPILFKLRKAFHEKGVKPTFYHEFIEDFKEYHTYMTIEVLENLDDV